MKNKITNAVIYCRVSTTRQVKKGDGLNSQEIRCRQYANHKGYKILKVFKDEGVSGSKRHRPAMQEVISFIGNLDITENKTVVIFDDIKRFSRDVNNHFQIKEDIYRRNALIESPSCKFEDTPEGKFIETILAGNAELERSQNRAQVINRMTAHVDSGRYPFRPPAGYKNNKKAKGGMVVDENVSRTVRNALDGYANNRFVNKEQTRDYMFSEGFFSRKGTTITKKAQLESVRRILAKAMVYAGWVCIDGASIRRKVKGKFQPLISEKTAAMVIGKLKMRKPPEELKSIKKEYPLRGYVTSIDLGKKFTASTSTGRMGRKYGYYHVPNSDGRNISVKQDVFENEFIKTLGNVDGATDGLLKLFEATVKDLARKRGFDVAREKKLN